jgi:hypothetical protein
MFSRRCLIVAPWFILPPHTVYGRYAILKVYLLRYDGTVEKQAVQFTVIWNEDKGGLLRSSATAMHAAVAASDDRHRTQELPLDQMERGCCGPLRLPRHRSARSGRGPLPVQRTQQLPLGQMTGIARRG